MPSSTSFPFEDRVKVLEIDVREQAPRRNFVTGDNQLFVRMRLNQAEAMNSLARMYDREYDREIVVSALVEVAPKSWTQADRIGSTWYSHKGFARVGIDTLPGDVDNEMLAQHAVRKAVDALQQPLETAVTLYGIAHNVDVHIEHGLRVGHNAVSLSHLLMKPLPFPSFKNL